MSRSPLDRDRFQHLQSWWMDLPLSYRVNTLLYLLGALALVVLLINLVTGNDNPRDTQVAAGVSVTTTTAFRGATTTRVNSPASTPTTVAGTTTTAGAGGGESGTPSASGGSGGGGSSFPSPLSGLSGGGSGGGGGGGTSGGGDTSGGGGGGTGGGGTGGGGGSSGGGSGSGGGGGGGGAGTTTTAPPACRNSTDSRCGPQYWDPQPTNQPPQVGSLVMNPGTAVAGQNAAFSVTVTEPDHGLSNACGTLDFGDGVSSGTCQEPPCSGKYGPWTPPTPPAGGTRTFSFQHTYAAPGAYTVIFKIESRDNCEDPYGTRYGLTFTRWNIVVAATPTGT